MKETMKLVPIALAIVILKSPLSTADGGSWRNDIDIKMKASPRSSSSSYVSSASASYQETDIHRGQGMMNGGGAGGGRDRYSSLPHTVFSPQGRLFNVEKAAQLSSDESDGSSSLVLAFQFGRDRRNGSGDEGSENRTGTINDGTDSGSMLILSTGSTSPYLYLPGTEEDKKKSGISIGRKVRGKEAEMKNQIEDKGGKAASPLFEHDVFFSSDEDKNESEIPTKIIPSMPLSILSPNIICGTGGNAVDSIVLHTKILELFLSLTKSYNGMNSTHRIRGRVGSSVLARKIADSLQVPTQNVGANSGRILSSSALVIGMNESPSPSRCSGNSIWRIDPTGQFWSCQAAAVGRGAGLVEAEMLRHVHKWKHDSASNTNNNDQPQKRGKKTRRGKNNYDADAIDIDILLSSISNDDVNECFGAMSFDDAIKFACDCIRKVHKLPPKTNTKGGSDIFDRVGIQGILIPGRCNGGQVSRPEMIHTGIIRNCLSTMESV